MYTTADYKIKHHALNASLHLDELKRYANDVLSEDEKKLIDNIIALTDKLSEDEGV